MRWSIMLLGTVLLCACGTRGEVPEDNGEERDIEPREVQDVRDPRDPARRGLLSRDPRPREPSETLAGRVMVINGDTLRVNGGLIFLSGVDAPEAGQLCRRDTGLPYRCGEEVTAILRNRVQRDRVLCDVAPVEPGVYEGICSHLGVELNAWLVRNGHAVARNQHSPYLEHEERAREERRGIWQGSFEPPREWRRRNR